jgi:hypothetical protein
MNKKAMTLTLLTVVAFAAVIGAYVMTAQATDTNSKTSDATATATPSGSLFDSGFDGGMVMNVQGSGGGFGGGRSERGSGDMARFGGMGSSFQLSADFNATINGILNIDTDVKNLISQGYNVTYINPLIQNVIGGDGLVTTQATRATVLMQNGTSGYAAVNVDITNAKVTQIVIVTRTVIDKNSNSTTTSSPTSGTTSS